MNEIRRQAREDSSAATVAWPSTSGTTAPGAVASALVQASLRRDSERAHAGLGCYWRAAGWHEVLVRGPGCSRRKGNTTFLIPSSHRTTNRLRTFPVTRPCHALRCCSSSISRRSSSTVRGGKGYVLAASTGKLGTFARSNHNRLIAATVPSFDTVRHSV